MSVITAVKMMIFFISIYFGANVSHEFIHIKLIDGQIHTLTRKMHGPDVGLHSSGCKAK